MGSCRWTAGLGSGDSGGLVSGSDAFQSATPMGIGSDINGVLSVFANLSDLMPANSKYLSSPSQRWLKISAAIFGGYFFSVSFHLLLSCIPSISDYVILFSGISFFLVWPTVMLLVFLFRKGQKAWFWLLGLSIGFLILAWLLFKPLY